MIISKEIIDNMYIENGRYSLDEIKKTHTPILNGKFKDIEFTLYEHNKIGEMQTVLLFETIIGCIYNYPFGEDIFEIMNNLEDYDFYLPTDYWECKL